MNRNKNSYKGKGKGKYTKGDQYKGKRDERENREYSGDDAKLDAKGRDNNPNWYFLDKSVAEQVSQLSFQQLAGLRVNCGQEYIATPNIMRVELNPCPGVQLSVDYSSAGGAQHSAINTAGFRLFSKIAAFTGRTQTYGPQDISTMILFMGEIISLTEYIRRVFGVSYLLSERNRSFPARLIRTMGVDPDDLFKNRSNYRDRFNYIITRINQIPIPDSIAYFDKCASLYEKIYMDSASPMGTIIFNAPSTTWELDEAGSAQGTVLRTHQALNNPDGTQAATYAAPLLMSAWLAILSNRVDELMNSSTFNVVYTDLLNLATKMKVTFWKFDYLDDSYSVAPEYNPNFLLQLHNSVAVNQPTMVSQMQQLGNEQVTPLNDVYPNASGNALYYNPAFSVNDAVSSVMVDSPVPEPGTVDRIEMTRFISLAGAVVHDTDQNIYFNHDMVLPDHYVTRFWVFTSEEEVRDHTNFTSTTGLQNNVRDFSAIDWAPMIYVVNKDSVSQPVKTGTMLGDLNFYTDMNFVTLRKLHDFVGLGLYEMRESRVSR